MGRVSHWIAGGLIGICASIAHAVPVVSLSASGVTTTAVAGATTINFNNGLCGYSACSGNYQIVSGSVSGQYAQPAGTNTPYLSVPNPVSNGTATFSLGTQANYFGLFWGSIDTYNSISFLLGGNVVATYSGAQFPPANGNQTDYESNKYINFEFVNGEMFDAVRFTSTNFAFESDNHAYRAVSGGSVPAPGPLALFGLGLAALGLRSRRKA
jgi:hypothetical protein